MIFILTEHIMNGTVTMDTIVTGVEGEDFAEAKAKVLLKISDSLFNCYRNDDQKIAYSNSGTWLGAFTTQGEMTNQPLKML